jgi:DNA-binding NtrC family response regulator
MDNARQIKGSRLETRTSEANSLTAFHLRSLKSLLRMLLNEVEFLETLTPEGQEVTRGMSLVQRLELSEMELIRTALLHSGGHQVNAAKLLDVRVTTLHAKMNRFGIDARQYSPLLGKEDEH